MRMKKEKEKSELEIISEFMTYTEYSIYTKDGLHLKCRLELKEGVSLNERWYGEVILKTRDVIVEGDGREVLLWKSDEPHDFEWCIKLMNDYIKDNFKTRLD